MGMQNGGSMCRNRPDNRWGVRGVSGIFFDILNFDVFSFRARSDPAIHANAMNALYAQQNAQQQWLRMNGMTGMPGQGMPMIPVYPVPSGQQQGQQQHSPPQHVMSPGKRPSAFVGRRSFKKSKRVCSKLFGFGRFLVSNFYIESFKKDSSIFN